MNIKTIVIDANQQNRADIVWNLGFFGGFEVLRELGSFEDLEQTEWEEPPQVAFISLELPTSDGFYCTYYLQKRFPDLRVVMMAEEKQYAFTAFEYGVFDYLLKPLEPQRIEKTVARLRDAFREDEAIIDSPKRIMVKLKGRYRMIDLEDILFLEMRNKRCSMTLQDGTEVGLQRYTMEQLETMFTPFGFFRCYQSIIVHLSKVAQLTANADGRSCIAHLKGYEPTVPVSRDKFNQMVALLEDSSGITVTGNTPRE